MLLDLALFVPNNKIIKGALSSHLDVAVASAIALHEVSRRGVRDSFKLVSGTGIRTEDVFLAKVYYLPYRDLHISGQSLPLISSHSPCEDYQCSINNSIGHRQDDPGGVRSME